ncbi:hypothetical protein SAMD00023353_3400210 [Rosellinia necatrix]|uniref:Uncharacterized protein n=1 Tax=Rosellinia necatrix TaxID=77044 RepID=A0A1S8A9W5_ROSNE|nr:hypothetical protein SAMD00023353_3400210 [Rosellinia necatrix]
MNLLGHINKGPASSRVSFPRFVVRLSILHGQLALECRQGLLKDVIGQTNSRDGGYPEDIITKWDNIQKYSEIHSYGLLRSVAVYHD